MTVVAGNVVMWVIVMFVGAYKGDTYFGQALIVLAFISLLINAGWMVADIRADIEEAKRQAPPRMGPR